MRKILITGGTGFIGYFISKRLSEDERNEITIIDNLSRGRMDSEFEALTTRANVSFIEGDLNDRNVWDNLPNDFDYIYHFAAVIGVKNVMNHADKVLYTNAISMLQLFEYCKRVTTLKKVLFSSTSEISAGTLKHFDVPVPTPEDVPLTLLDIKGKRSTYALSKMYGESICYTYGAQYNIPFTIVRYFNIFGPRMGFAHVIPEMFVKINKAKTIDVASPAHTRAFCFVDDAVDYTIQLAEDPATDKEIVNVGNSTEEIQIKPLVSLIADVMGKEITIQAKDDTPGSPNRRCPDTSRLLSFTKRHPKVPLRLGIAKTFLWYQSRLDLAYE